MRAQPRRQVLAASGLRVQIPARTEHAHKHVRLPGAAGLGINHRHRVAGEIDKHPLTSCVLQAHDDVLAAQPPTIVTTELGIPPAVGMRLLVLQVQQLQRDVLATLVLVVNFQPIRFGPI